MKYEEFISAHERRWEHLRTLSERIRTHGHSALAPDELDSFLLLYRQACADLSYIRTNFPNSRMEKHLNDLVASSHAQLTRVRSPPLRRVIDFYARVFPHLFAKNVKFVGLAFALFMSVALVTAVGMKYDREFFMDLSPIPEPVLQERASRGSVGPNMDGFIAPVETSYIFVNNIQVGIMTYGMGIFLGLGTVFYLYVNGLMLGVVCAFFAEEGLGIAFMANILPHGILELTAIFICGGAGFMLGEAVVNPGELPRSQAVAKRGREATQLVAGSMLLFLIAGLIEGYFSFVETIAHETKLAFCIIPAGFLYLYLLRHIGREEEYHSVLQVD